MNFDRQRIIAQVAAAARASADILALWEGGSAAFRHSDAYSDIDLEAVIRPGTRDSVVDALKSAVTAIASIAREFRPDESHGSQYCWQLHGVPPWNFIDITFQDHRPSGHAIDTGLHGSPIIHVDKVGCVTLCKETASVRDARIRDVIVRAAAMCDLHPVLVEKQLQRGDLLQAFGEYQRFMVRPLIELLRAKHCPQRSSWQTTSITWDLPPDINQRLRGLVVVADIAAMRAQLAIVTAWKRALIEELRTILS
jgi:hypothetical protein